jgi:isopentenyldiphosphate isomerase
MEELFEILDASGTKTGQTLPRSQVHREGQWHRSVHIWVVDEWGRMLLQQRAFSKDSNPGLWDISAAGHISAGQNSREAAVRELEEEIGLHVNPERLQFLFEDQDQCILQGGKFIDHEFHDIYLLRLNPGESRLVKPDPGELAGVRWFTPEIFLDELQTTPECFVRHDHEYPRIIQIILGE